MSLFVPIYKFFTHKNSSTWLNLQKLCILGPITCHRLTLEGKLFCITGKTERRTKNPVVMNLNISADDINTFKVSNTMGKFCQIFKMSNIWANRKVLFPKVKVLIFLNPIQAGLFWNHIGLGGGGGIYHCAPPLFLLYLLSNYH